MSELVPANMGQMSSVFANTPSAADDLSAGVSGGFGHIGYKGKVFSIRYRGNETTLMRDDGDGPRNSIEVVIIKSSPVVSKIFYENGYVEGSNNPPDCYSTNGATPDVGAQKKQAPACGTCPKNQWGSRITNEGRQAKACSDSRRIAVVPMNDIKNEVFGGPLLLRIPAASLQDLAHYGASMNQLGYQYFAIATRISFDPAQAFPKFQFNPIRALTDEEARMVLEMQGSPEVGRILAESNDFAQQAPQSNPAVSTTFEQPPQLAAPAPTPGSTGAAQPAAGTTGAPAQPAPQPATQPSNVGGFGPVASAPAAQPQTNVVQMPQQAAQPAPAEASAETASDDDFAKRLDEQLGELLPS